MRWAPAGLPREVHGLPQARVRPFPLLLIALLFAGLGGRRGGGESKKSADGDRRLHTSSGLRLVSGTALPGRPFWGQALQPLHFLLGGLLCGAWGMGRGAWLVARHALLIPRYTYTSVCTRVHTYICPWVTGPVPPLPLFAAGKGGP